MAKVLVVGSGGREHALAVKLSQSKAVDQVFVAPGNDAMDFERWEADLGRFHGFQMLAERAQREKIDLAVIGPDNPLADGIVDVFEQNGILTFGPSKAAAHLEASKSFSKEIMRAAGVPTAQYRVVTRIDEAKQFLKSAPWKTGWVVKADGLALGKGVIVCRDLPNSLDAVDRLFPLSKRLVIEERLVGEELSCMAFCAGETVAMLDTARDYKPLLEGQKGPNTGGMGSYSPVVELPDHFLSEIREKVFLPTLRELNTRGIRFKGLLYAGLMRNALTDRYWVLEFNARFGDPETQALLPRMKDDLYLWCKKVAEDKIDSTQVEFHPEASVYVVGAAAGYPDRPVKGSKITGIQGSWSTDKYFAAGVKKSSQGWVTSGGRVLGALGLGKDLPAARKTAYQNLSAIQFEGMQFRTDIGNRMEPEE